MLGFGALGEFALGEGPVGSQTFVGGQFSQPSRSRKLAVAVIATTFVGFVAPPTPAKAIPFTKFSEPHRKKPLPQSFTNAPQPAFSQPYVFSRFSEPTKPRYSIFDENQSVFDNPEPPPLPPFTGFAKFEGVVKARFNIAPFTNFNLVPFVVPADTHDGVYVRRKRRRGPDPIELEIQERKSRRAALELAVYGPPVEMTGEIPVIVPVVPPKPPNVEELTRVVMALQQAQQEAKRQADMAADEDDLEAFLREIF